MVRTLLASHRHRVLFGCVLLFLVLVLGGYAYLDWQADRQAKTLLATLAEKAKDNGQQIQYQSVDASPLFHTITISKLSMTGGGQEPDITLGHINMTMPDSSGLTAQPTTSLPSNMHITIQDGEIYLKPTLITADRNIQALAEYLGNTLHFSLSLGYHLNDEGQLIVTVSHTLDQQYQIQAQAVLGHAVWLRKLNQSGVDLASEIIKTTLQRLDIYFHNHGIIEQLRTVAVKRTGMTQAQLMQDSVRTLKKLRIAAEKNWGPLFLPLIDEIIIFTQKPEQLRIHIQPNPPLDSDALMLALRGGNAGVLELIKKANFQVQAN